MFFQDKFETNLFQLFTHPLNSKWFSIIFAIIFEVNIVAAQMQARLVTIFVLYKLLLPSNLLLLPCCYSDIPDSSRTETLVSS